MYRLIPNPDHQKVSFKFNFGLNDLIQEWKQFFSMQYLREDLIAGLSVACIAIPLSLAIALASGVDPVVGLTTAVIGSVVCALFGGTPLSVSGPGQAMAVLIADVIQRHGLKGLLLVGVFCGFLQISTGVFRLGRLVRFVPLPVLAGLTAGMGAIIFVGQIPRALGLPSPDQSHVLSVVTHILDLLHTAQMQSFTLAIFSMILCLGLPSLFPRIPAALIAVVIPSFVAVGMGLHVPTIERIPHVLPSFHLPEWVQGNIGELVWTSFIVFVLASFETLMASSAIDKLSKSKRHDPDQELIGQGLGNILSSLFGGIPVTGLFARSALNVYVGAKTRRAAIFHGVFLVGAVFLAAHWMTQIPLAVLAGVILSVALRMVDPREFFYLWKTSSIEALIYLITFFVTIFVDLVVGVQSGVIAALAVAAIRMGRTQTRFYQVSGEGPVIISLDGGLSFLASARLEEIRNQLQAASAQQRVVFDLSKVESMDASGANLLVDLLDTLEKRGVRFVIKGLSQSLQRVFLASESAGQFEDRLALSESGVQTILGGPDSGLNRLVYGVERFRKELSAGYSSIFKSLESDQTPHTLFITCSDSRINPNLITSTEPGELFVIRNVGNIVPSFGQNGAPAEGAAIEFALVVLGVKEIVLCGHSHCGAIKYALNNKILSPEQRHKTPSLAKWMSQVYQLKKEFTSKTSVRQAIELNVMLQVENLKTYPSVQEKLASGELRIHAWYYDIGNAELDEWDEKLRMFVRVGSQSIARRIEAGVQFQVPIPSSQNLE